MTDAGLTAAAQRAAGAPGAPLQDVRREPVAYDAFLAARTVSRVRGSALTAAGPVEWSMIEKSTEGPATASAYLYDNALREFRAFESGLLDRLAPAVFAPAVHGLQRARDGALTLWMDDLGEGRPPLGRADILGAARDLGRLAGGWIGRVPAEPWLFTGWISRHGQPETVERDLGRLRAVRSRRAVEARLGWRIDDAVRLIEAQGRVGATLDSLPQTLCHHDAVGANVFRRVRPNRTETVLIDWEMVGAGSVGADLVSLVFASARRGDASAAAARTLLPDALDAYAVGVGEAGGEVDERTLTLAFHTAVALRWALARDLIVAVDEGADVRRGSAPDEPPEAAMEELITLAEVLFDSAAAAGVL